MTLTPKVLRCASANVSSTTSAWFDGEGRAPSRIRPALGQPTSPIMISLFGMMPRNLVADGVDMGGRLRSRQREVLPVWQDVDGDEIDGRCAPRDSAARYSQTSA